MNPPCTPTIQETVLTLTMVGQQTFMETAAVTILVTQTGVVTTMMATTMMATISTTVMMTMMRRW